QKTPSYIRVTKASSPVVYTNPVSSINAAIELFSGNDASVFVTGSLLPIAKQVAENLQKKNISVSLFSMPQIKPLDEKTILREAKKMKKIITIEDHYITGGLGSAVSEVIAASNAQIPVLRLGIKDVFTSVTGSVDYLLSLHDLSAEGIEKSIINFIK
ncbi:MAG TPA: transketolase C-terminal domain-containing protein, partial [Patescibacteria group bacterium]